MSSAQVLMVELVAMYYLRRRERQISNPPRNALVCLIVGSAFRTANSLRSALCGRIMPTNNIIFPLSSVPKKASQKHDERRVCTIRPRNAILQQILEEVGGRKLIYGLPELRRRHSSKEIPESLSLEKTSRDIPAVPIGDYNRGEMK